MVPREQAWCLGDSHIRAFRRVRLPGVWFRIVSVRGATASGIRNPQSKTEALKTFRGVLGHTHPRQHVFVGLGEVDCGFVIWHRAAARGVPIDAQLQHTLERYFEFIDELRSHGFRSVNVLSAPMPTVADYRRAWANRVAHLRSQIDADLLERVTLTRDFNTRLERHCLEVGASFVDTSSGEIDPDTGLVREELIDPLGQDHHLVESAYAELIRQKLLRAGFPRGR